MSDSGARLILSSGPDGGASLAIGDRPVAAAREAWFPESGGSLPLQALHYCLERSGVAMREVDALMLVHSEADAPSRGGLFQRLRGAAPKPEAALREAIAAIDPSWKGQVLVGPAADGPTPFLSLATGQDGRIGPEFTQSDIERRLAAAGAVFEVFDEASIAFATAEELNLGRHVGWFQGPMSFTGGDLPVRCVLCNPKDADAVALLKSRLYLGAAPLVSLVLPESADAPAGSLARSQVIEPDRDGRLSRMVRQFAASGGGAVVGAAPLRMGKEPLACTPEAAFELFLTSEIDVLVIGACYLRKRGQDIELKARFVAAYDPNKGDPVMQRPPSRVVRLHDDYPRGDYARFQANFMDQMNHCLIPSTRVYVGDELVFESNALSCKGPELEPGRPIIGVFGDSVVQGAQMDSFAGHVRVGPCQPLNGGVEGSQLHQTIDRFLEVQAKAPMVCVALHTGWHNLVYGEAGEAYWREQLDRVQGPPVIAHFRMVADFHPDALTRGYDKFFREGYWSWHDGRHTQLEHLPAFKAAVDGFNDFIARYCAEKGRVLIDLEPVLAPATYDTISDNFIDLIHPRTSVYQAMGESLAEQLKPHVLPLVGGTQAPTLQPAAPAPAVVGGAPQIGRTYPLW